MNKKKIIKLVVSFICLGFAGYGFSNQKVEAKKNGVKIFESADKKSSVVAKLKKGEAIDALERKGMYWKVKHDGKEAYVSVFKVKKLKDSSAISAALREAVKQGREEGDGANARQRSAVMGVRGLDESEDTAFAGNVKPNLRMVYAMEDLLVTTDEISTLEESVFSEAEKNAQKKGL